VSSRVTSRRSPSILSCLQRAVDAPFDWSGHHPSSLLSSLLRYLPCLCLSLPQADYVESSQVVWVGCHSGGSPAAVAAAVYVQSSAIYPRSTAHWQKRPLPTKSHCLSALLSVGHPLLTMIPFSPAQLPCVAASGLQLCACVFVLRVQARIEGLQKNEVPRTRS